MLVINVPEAVIPVWYRPRLGLSRGTTVLYGFKEEQLYAFYFVVWPEEVGRCWRCPLIE